MELLENSRWGFESNCFVCEPRNDSGLGIAFHRDDAHDVVTASFDLDDRVCATAEATFVPLGQAQMVDAVGPEVGGADAGFVRST